MSEPMVLELTERELDEIKHALFYVNDCNHGTVGHNMLVLIAKLATQLGFSIEPNLHGKSPAMISLNTLYEAFSVIPEKR